MERAVSPGRGIPTVRAPEPRLPEDTAQDPALPAGQAEAGRAQDSKDTPAATTLSSADQRPRPRRIQNPADWELR